MFRATNYTVLPRISFHLKQLMSVDVFSRLFETEMYCDMISNIHVNFLITATTIENMW